MSSEYKAARHRSPAHPALTLRVAIEKAQALWNQDGLVWVPAQVAVEHMGYAHTNGNGGRALAALSYFGLVERDGKSDDRRVRLTPLGQAIVMDDRPDSPEREQAIRRAALSPKLYAAIWENLGEGSQLPSDANLEFALKSTYRVNKDTVGKFVRDFRATLEFAGLIGDAATATPDDMANDPDDGPAAVTVERETASPCCGRRPRCRTPTSASYSSSSPCASPHWSRARRTITPGRVTPTARRRARPILTACRNPQGSAAARTVGRYRAGRECDAARTLAPTWVGHRPSRPIARGRYEAPWHAATRGLALDAASRQRPRAATPAGVVR